jgi:protoporphyrinogen IX oxidase
MLWIKSFHIVFVASWFAGLFYLPRIFVNLAQVSPGSDAEYDRLVLMARKLMRFMTLLMLPAVGLGLWLWFVYWFDAQTGGWLHAKMLLVFLTLVYHHRCGVYLRQFEACANEKTHTWFRWFNEIPVVLMMIIVILVVVKPF